MAKSDSQKGKEKRARKAALGLVKCELYVRPANQAMLKALENDMRERDIDSIAMYEDGCPNCQSVDTFKCGNERECMLCHHKWSE